MSFERAEAYLEQAGFGGRIITPEQSSATVEEAAAALGCEPEHIAKTMSFIVDGAPILIVCAGDARVDNHKFKERFHTKAKMIHPDEVEELVGHAPGGVCPFGVNEGVAVYLDESLRRFDVVYPAAGNGHSAVRLTVAELEQVSRPASWVDVCKLPQSAR